jgi:hypothetical protein
MTVQRRTLALAASILLIAPAALSAQGIRGELRVRGDIVGFQRLQRDSVPESEVTGTGARRQLANGTVVSCTTGDYCRWYGSGETEDVYPVYQDLRATAWTGVEGLSLHTQLRGRLGSDDAWPRTEQEVEAITAYIGYRTDDLWLRAGRMLRSGSLGYKNFDGGSVAWSGLGPLRLEAYGGWSLGVGLNAPRNGQLLTEADEWAPDKRAYIYGFDGALDFGTNFFANVQYQREIRTDETGLYSERIGGSLRAIVGDAILDGGITYDLAYKEINLARLQMTSPLGGGFGLVLEARHYRPFFEYWTIWGAFSPVAYSEGRGMLTWTSPGLGLTLEAGGGYRDYDETDAGVEFVDIKEDGVRLYGGGHWVSGPWFVDGGYRSETGFGASRYGGDLTVGRQLGDDARIALFGSSTRSFGEFRVGEQLGTGGGVDASWNLGDFTVAGSAAMYRITFDNRSQNEDWTQPRAHLSVAWRFGSAPKPRPSMRGIGGY